MFSPVAVMWNETAFSQSSVTYCNDYYVLEQFLLSVATEDLDVSLF
jgi:hypothetical protein